MGRIEIYRSVAFEDIEQPDFADVVIVSIPHTSNVIEPDPAVWAREIFSVRSAPAWIQALLGLRQALVRLIGVRPAGEDVFAIDETLGSEALIATDDTHLDFRAAVHVDVDMRRISVTTAVRLHGWRGRLYFAPVRVLHDAVTRAMVSRAIARHIRGDF